MTKDQVKQYIDEKIYDNTDGIITGVVMNDVMKQVVDSGIDDAPSDGKTYGRKDGAWAEAQSKTDESLKTTDKTVAGAINEIKKTADNALPKDEQALDKEEKSWWQKVIAQAFAELYSIADALGKAVDHAGYLRADMLDMADLPKVCGEEMYMTGEGAPSAPPRVPFQEYYDIDNRKFYKAKGSLPDNPSVSDWVALN